MTMHDEWTNRLSDYLDDELTPGERRAVEQHLAGCESCATALEELKRVVERARTLPARPPQTDLWNGIAQRIGAAGAPAKAASEAGPAAPRVVPFQAREPWRISFTLPQLAAASLLLAVVSGGAAWRLHTSPAAQYADRTSGTVPLRPGPDVPADATSVEPVGLADAQYDSAVADLQRALQKGRGHLDPATITIVEQNLKIIDRAIDQARQAVTNDPGNSYLTSHLVETRRKKLDLLRRAAALASETN